MKVLIFGLCLSFTRPAEAVVDYVPYYFPPEVKEETRLELVKIVQSLMETAQQKMVESDILGAVKFLNAAIQVLPNDYRPFGMLAEMYLRLGQLERFWETVELGTRYYTDTNLLLGEVMDLYDMLESAEEDNLESPFIAPFKNYKRSAFSFMFDDGESNVVNEVIPIFKSFGMTATIPINPGHTSEAGENSWRGRWADWIVADAQGFEISNHALNHQNLVGLSTEDLNREINGSYDIILEKLEKKPYSFVFPFNQFDESTIRVAGERHPALRQPKRLRKIYEWTMVPIYGGEQFSLATGEKLVDFAIKHGFWIIPVCHGLRVREFVKSYKPVTNEFLTGHLAYLKQNEKNVWVDTFANVHRYLQTRNQAQLVIRAQDQNHIAFSLEGGLDEEEVQELTVVIPVSDQVLFVTAEQVEDKIPLDVRVVGAMIVLNVPVNGKMVEVNWK